MKFQDVALHVMALVILVLAGFMPGCSHALTQPTNFSNAALAATDSAAQVLQTECADKYAAERLACPARIQASKSKSEAIDAYQACNAARAKLDAFCVPATDAHEIASAAHAALVAAIAASAARDGGDTALVIQRAAELASAIERLGRILSERSKR